MNNTKTRIIFFTIALTYNLILGFYLRDFLVLSPTLQVFYLLSVLPTLFLAVEIESKAVRAAVYISLMLIACINFAYAVYCRRVFPFWHLFHLLLFLCILSLSPIIQVKILYWRKYLYWWYFSWFYHYFSPHIFSSTNRMMYLLPIVKQPCGIRTLLHLLTKFVPTVILMKKK